MALLGHNELILLGVTTTLARGLNPWIKSIENRFEWVIAVHITRCAPFNGMLSISNL